MGKIIQQMPPKKKEKKEVPPPPKEETKKDQKPPKQEKEEQPKPEEEKVEEKEEELDPETKEKIEKEKQAKMFEKYLDESGLSLAFKAIFSEILSKKIPSDQVFGYTAMRLRQLEEEISKVEQESKSPKS
eukprot:TRINITY_DN22088_c0_g1_i2.p2 TRINITY_DN22088_c0_g1~~TRINITY_DN22088_c0_g1_i2.p2  ORF type:complete len:130 (-),score=49.12 TRINITY_DN22088_c0_g1_i2:70-459(-)